MSDVQRLRHLHRAAVVSLLALGACGGVSGDTRDWQTAQFLETSAVEAGNADVAINFSGAGYAVWGQIDNRRSRTFPWRSSLGPWENAEPVSTGTATGQQPTVAMGPDGNALAAWREESNVGGVVAERIFVRPFVNGGWRGVTALADTFPDGALSPTVAVAPDGRGVVAWQQKQGNSFDGLARIAVDTAHGQWSGVGFLCNGDCKAPRVTMDPFGRATVVFALSTVRVDVFAAHFNGSLWLPSVNIETHRAGDAFSPSVVSDALGRVVAVWRRASGEQANPATRTSLLANRFDPAEGAWAAPETIETDDSGSADAPSLAMNAAGRALAEWDFSVPANPAAVLSVVGNALQ